VSTGGIDSSMRLLRRALFSASAFTPVAVVMPLSNRLFSTQPHFQALIHK
jgi:hypothetical protein